jgi:N-acetylmuramoyl-L-alanine amidase
MINAIKSAKKTKPNKIGSPGVKKVNLRKTKTSPTILCLLGAFLAASTALTPAQTNAANNVTGLTVRNYTDYTAVIVKLQKPSVFKVSATKDGRLAIIIDDCAVSPSAAKLNEPVGVVDKVTSATIKGRAYIYVTPGKGAKNYEGKAFKTPPQIFFKLYKKPTTAKAPEKAPEKRAEPIKEKPAVAAKGEFPTSAKEIKPDSTPTVIDTICIDPGHGGRFTGAEGPDGTLEKDVNLQISLRLARLLRDRLGVRVVMTRIDDSHVYMRDRTGLANAVNADLFIDLHNNAVLNAKVGGTETYFLSQSWNDWERAATIAENQDFLAENPNFAADPSSLNFILSLLAQNEYLQESSELAHYCQQNLTSELGLRDRGVKQAPFFVLVGCEMPSILLEIAFISNSHEEELLNDPAWQQKAAEAVFDGIKMYKEAYDRTMGPGGR